MLRLSDLLAQSGLALTQVAVVLHTPKERRFAQMLPTLAHERPELFEAYQATHGSVAEATLRKRTYVAAFIGMSDSSLLFAGLFQKDDMRLRSRIEIGEEPAVRSLIEEFSVCQEFSGDQEGDWLWFDFRRIKALDGYVGRLRIAPKLTQTYVRLAEKFDVEVAAIERESALVGPAPDWQKMICTGQEVRVLPESWKARLREWRGVYLIVDQLDGKRYVGSAYGDESNILGRWQTHVAKDLGVTVELSKRDPANFRFSILQLVAKDAPAEDVIRVERNWMDRLDTIQNGLNK